MESGSRVVSRSFHLALLIALVAAGRAGAQDFQGKSGICEFDESGNPLCGHALAAIARMEAEAADAAAGDAAAAAAAAEAQADTDVTHCFLDLEVNTATSTIAGSNTLYVTSLINGLTQMTLDLRGNMAVDAVTVNGVAATHTRPTNQILITLGATYNLGSTFQVKVTYHGTPEDRTDWISPFFTYHPTTDTTQPIFSTLSQPFYANRWWPCKENTASGTIDDKFTMDTWVTVPNTMIVASNGLLQGTDTLSGNRLRYRWHESYPIATYLVSVAATNYTKQVYTYNYPGGSMPVEFYMFPERVTEAQPYLANIVQAIATYSEYYGQYPFINEKYGIAQFPWCCGMEHQTITSQGAYTSETRNVHELSHMWWGDNVTCKTWHDIWLNEGFAIFSNAFWLEKKPGGSYASSLAYLNGLVSSYPAVKTGTDTVYRYDTSTSSAIFSTTYAYNKAGWVVHMLRHVLGDATFFNCLAAWRDAYGGSAGDTEDFRAICETTAGLAPGALAWFFDQWVYNPGSLYYRYGWEQEQIDGRNWVRLHVEQRQKAVISSLFPNAMKMPVNITINTAGGSQSHVIWNDATGAGNTVTEWFLLPANGPVTSVQFDKDTHILRNDPVATATYVKGPPKIIGIAAVAGAPSIEVQFSEPVVCTAANFTVTSSGTQPFTFSYNSALYRATLTLSAPLAAGQTVTVQAAAAITSQAAGISLDGEVTGGLPSGDGLPGGTAIYTFEVAPAPPVEISNVQVSTTAFGATVTWQTSKPADSLVRFGPTASYGRTAGSSALVTSHSIKLESLQPGTIYHYQVVSAEPDSSDETTDATFVTMPIVTEYVIDNLDPGWANTSPSGLGWLSGASGSVPKIGTNYLYVVGVNTTEADASRKCTWMPNLSVAGRYDVYVYYQIGPNRNSSACYRTFYDGSSTQSIQNQYSTTANQGGWFLIGANLPFQTGMGGYVQLSNNSVDTRYVSADAAKFVLKPDTTPPLTPVVSAGSWTSSRTSLSASWVSTDPQMGIKKSEYRIVRQGGALVRDWTNAGTEFNVTATGLALEIGETYIIEVRTTNFSDLVSSVGASGGITVFPFDTNGDRHVTGSDLDAFEACTNGPRLAYPADAGLDCVRFDVDFDNDVDGDDFGVFQRCLTGPSQEVDPACLDQ